MGALCSHSQSLFINSNFDHMPEVKLGFKGKAHWKSYTRVKTFTITTPADSMTDSVNLWLDLWEDM